MMPQSNMPTNALTRELVDVIRRYQQSAEVAGTAPFEMEGATETVSRVRPKLPRPLNFAAITPCPK